MRIGNGPRLVVPRAGITSRRWGYYGRKPGYERFLSEQWARIRSIRCQPHGDAKNPVRTLSQVKQGKFFRLVDEHGKSYGKRYQRGVNDFRLAVITRVRIVEAQAESLHSQLSRMLKRAHRISIRED